MAYSRALPGGDYEFETYEEGIYLQGICLEDTAEVWLDSEYVYMSGAPDWRIYWELMSGARHLVFERYVRCGNKTIEEQRYVN